MRGLEAICGRLFLKEVEKIVRNDGFLHQRIPVSLPPIHASLQGKMKTSLKRSAVSWSEA